MVYTDNSGDVNMNWRIAFNFRRGAIFALRPVHRPRLHRLSRAIAAWTVLSSSSDFFEYDPRAHLQIDGKAVTLAKRFALSGSRYSGGGVTLKITKAGTTVKHARRSVTACELA